MAAQHVLQVSRELKSSGVIRGRSFGLPRGVTAFGLRADSSRIGFGAADTSDLERTVGPPAFTTLDLTRRIWTTESARRGAGIAAAVLAPQGAVWVEARPEPDTSCDDASFGCRSWELRWSRGPAVRTLDRSHGAVPARAVPDPRMADNDVCWTTSSNGRSWIARRASLTSGAVTTVLRKDRWLRSCLASGSDTFINEWTTSDSTGETLGRGDVIQVSGSRATTLLWSHAVDVALSKSRFARVDLRNPASGERQVWVGRRGDLRDASPLDSGTDIYSIDWVDDDHLVVSTAAGVTLYDLPAETQTLLSAAVDPSAKVAAGGGHVAYVPVAENGATSLVVLDLR